MLGASAGGVEPLRTVVRDLPADLSATVLVVLHVSPSGTSALPAILERAAKVPVTAAADGDALAPGTVFVAPPGCHLLVDGERLRVDDGPRENGHRPAIDATMRTAAASWNSASAGVVLSGTRDDGTAGAAAIKRAGGRVAVQDPEEAPYPQMPSSVLAHVEVDAVLRVGQIGAWLAQVPAADESLVHLGGIDDPAPTAPTRFTCPDCGGVLFETTEDGVWRYRCSVGHAYSPQSLAEDSGRQLERALWTAVRTLEDRMVLLRRLADRADAAGQHRSARSFREQADEQEANAEVLRATLHFPPPGAGAPPQGEDGGAPDETDA